jgi:hypothetical protein
VNELSPAVMRTFNDDEHEQEYRRSGVVVLPAPILDADQVASLRDLSGRTAPPDDHGIANDYCRDDRMRLRTATSAIRPMLEETLAELFADHRLVLASFIVKAPGDESAMVLHEDRTHVDERHHRGGNLWITLDDVGPDLTNGGIEVLPRSHLLTDNLVGTRTPDPWRPYERFLRRHLVRPELPAGAAVYYDNRTLHASPANETATARVAVACLIVPRTASLRHVVATGRRRRIVYAVDDAFFLDVAPQLITARSMQPYDVLDEVDETDEDLSLDPHHLVAVIAGEANVRVDDARPDVIPPPDGVSRRPRRLPAVAVDPPEPVGTPAASDATVEGFVRTTASGGHFDLFVLSDPAERHREPPRWAGAVEALDLDGRCAAILVLGEGAVIEVEVALDDRRQDHWDLDVIEVPWVAAHLGVDGGDEVLDNHHSLSLSRPRVALWNHGPGSAALLISVVRGETTPPAVEEPAGATPHETVGDQPSAGAGARLRRSLRRLARR